MQLDTRLLVIALTVLFASAPCLAVVHGIQPLSVRHDTSPGNSNGYRYNGPAHKYLPAASELTTEAVTTTGHWQPNPGPQAVQQAPYEHTYGSISTDYSGPYSMDYYERQPSHSQNDFNAFQYAPDNTVAAGAAAGAEPGQAYGLSVGAQHDRRVESGQRGAQVIGQALPERYQRQPFVRPVTSSSSYLQMQSQSYELPPTYSMQREWPEQQILHVQKVPGYVQQQQQYEQPQQQPQYEKQQQQYEQPQQQEQLHPPQQLGYPQSTRIYGQEQSKGSAYVTPPSREFLAPYY